MVSAVMDKPDTGWIERETRRAHSDLPEIWTLLDSVCDPEIPVLSLFDLGVLHDIRQLGDCIKVSITPTYSGCPALETMRDDILKTLSQAGFEDAQVEVCLSPVWSSNWMSPEGRRKLKDYGIAPPMKHCRAGDTPDAGIGCPFCGSHNTARLSEFGATACKAMFTCADCKETFDFFKNI